MDKNITRQEWITILRFALSVLTKQGRVEPEKEVQEEIQEEEQDASIHDALNWTYINTDMNSVTLRTLRNVCMYYDINTVSQLADFSRSTLAKTVGVGQRAMEYFERMLAHYDLSFKI